MAPGPEHRQEPVAPDKIAESDRAATAADVVVDVENVDATTTGSDNDDAVAANTATVAAAVVAVTAEQSSNVEIAPASFAAGADPISQSSPPNSGADSKQVSIVGGRVEESSPIESRNVRLIMEFFLPPPPPLKVATNLILVEKLEHSAQDVLGVFESVPKILRYCISYN
ncbi:hypothetical protein X777_12380 [Ooceraea biroi]|uniref:Uncharacterized protein n=1 Tax=Ooceraea biroi TaxID=2015173 RepID=A0A026W0A6_OOCBI|nr:hypothetical protein X777_12380 [Ooceraea biroi]